jgi:hypothetical protein
MQPNSENISKIFLMFIYFNTSKTEIIENDAGKINTAPVCHTGLCLLLWLCSTSSSLVAHTYLGGRDQEDGR